MTTKSHKLLTGTQLHEPKGADAAAANKVYVSDGLGSGAWQKLTASQLTTTGNPFGGNMAHFRDEKTAGTNGGSMTLGVWTTRTLNTSATNEISGASLSANQITLPAGTYMLDASAPVGTGVQHHVLRWRNITNGTSTLWGQNSQAPGTAAIRGRFTTATTKVFELQHFSQDSQADTGLGASMLQGTEVYAEVLLWKVG